MIDPKQFENFPEELRAESRWCGWRNVPKQDKPWEFTKVPYQSLYPQRKCDKTNPDHQSSFYAAVQCVIDLANKMSGIGYCIDIGVLAFDLDNCLVAGEIAEWALKLIAGLPPSYTEVTPSKKGLRIIWLVDPADVPEQSFKVHFAPHTGAEVLVKGSYITVTGDVWAGDKPLPLARISKSQIESLVARVKALKRPEAKIEVVSRHDDLNKLGYKLYKAGCSASEVADVIRARNKSYPQPKDEAEVKRVLDDLARDAKRGKIVPNSEIDPETWREGFYSFNQLPNTPARFLLDGLIPEKAFTAICAPSYNCKTWLALMMALAISTGHGLWGFGGPTQPVPVAYHVPEMNAALIRRYMTILGFEDSEMFLVRPMELGLWALNDPRLLRSAEGRMNFFDTAGYFNPADDSSSYQQSLKFAALLNNLLQNGAVAVAGLFHPPKSASQENQSWTLENSILGSAGYGGMLRSCLRMKNLNPDLNDEKVWVYVQGMKNPGLKPFQLEGPMPLKMKVSPGESPYLKDLDVSAIDPRRELAFKGFNEKKPHKALARELKVSNSDLTKWRKEWVALREPQAEEDPPADDLSFEPELF